MSDRDQGREQERDSGDDGSREPGWLGRSGAPAEWAVGVISALLVLSALGYTAADALRSPQGPPILFIQADSLVATPGGHLVLFTVRNDGTETAASVQVHGALAVGGETVEESQATIDYVPEGARRRGSLLFQEDPGSHRLELRVTGFAFP